MPDDYNLGVAHGTIKIDYDRSGAKDARDDVQDVGDEATRSSEKVDRATQRNEESYAALSEAARRASSSFSPDTASHEQLSAAVKKLEKDVTDASAAALGARERLTAAETRLREARDRGNASTEEVAQLERSVRQAQQSVVSTTDKLHNSTRALATTRERLARVPSPRPIDPGDMSALQHLLGQLRAINSNTNTAVKGINTFSGRLKFMLAAVALATPGVAGLGVALASLAGLAGVAAGGVAALGATAATVATGMGGIADAFKASSDAAKAAGSSAGASASAQRAAARAIEQAKRSLTDAEENLRRVQEDAARAAIQAARQVADAQKDLINAQREAVRAQASLNKARQQAVRDLEDMRDALTGGALDERQAVLDLTKAQEDLDKVKADPTANADDIAQATLNYDKATFALQQARKEQERLTVDQAAAAKAGVAGSDQVVSAQDAIRSSTEQVANAQQALADAQENVRQTQIDSARAVQDAMQGVADAQEAVRDAMLDAAEKGAAAGAKLNDALANLSPNARAFVQEVNGIRGAWDNVRRSVQDKLFEGLAAEVKPLAQEWFPLLEAGMGKVATGLNGIVHSVVDYLHTAEAQQDVAHIFDNTALAVGNLKNFVRDLLAAFLDIASVGSDFLPDMATGAANAAARFREFVSAAKESGRLREWMQGAMDTVSTLWQLIKNLADIIGTVFTALDQNGGGALNTLTEITGKLAEFLHTAEGQSALQSLGKILAAIGGAYAKVFIVAIEAIAKILVAVEPLITAFADSVGDYLAVAIVAVTPILQGIATVLGFLGPALGPVIAGIYAANKAVAAAKIAWAALSVVMNANPFIAIAALVVTLALLIIQNWDAVKAALGAAWQWIQDTAAAIWARIKDNIIGPLTAAWDGIKAGWNAVVEFLTGLWNSIYTKVKETFLGILRSIQDTLNNMREAVRNGVNNVIQFFKDLPGNILGFLKSLPGKMVQAGKDIIMGIVNGLADFAHYIWDKITDIVSDAWDAVTDFFGISSPSKLMAWAGEMLARGLAEGIADNTNKAVSAAGALADAVGSELTSSAASLATNLQLTGDTSGLPNSLPMNALVSGAAGPGAAAARESVGGGDGGKTVILQIDNLTLQVSGNLDPTNPTAFRKTLVNLKDALRNLDKEYA